MKKLTVKNSEIMQIALQQEIIRSEEARYDNKLHGVLLASSGMSCYEIANVLGRSARTIQYWVKRFNQFGFSGLREQEGRGRPGTLNDEELDQIGNDIRKSPRDFGYNQSMWDGKLLSHHIAVKFEKDIGIRQCQRLFRNLGFRFRKPRPVIAQANPEEQESFKKTPKKKAK